MDVVSQRIKRRLGELDRDYTWLARLVNVSQSSMSRLVNGQTRMTVEQLRDIALVLHRPVSYFTDGEAEDAEEAHTSSKEVHA